MDRILRPQGYALIRESSYFVDAVATISKGLRWDCHVEAAEDATMRASIKRPPTPDAEEYDDDEDQDPQPSLQDVINIK
ncbi:probable methyltransferase PMT21, partial [Tanacetum coccineum]